VPLQSIEEYEFRKIYHKSNLKIIFLKRKFIIKYKEYKMSISKKTILMLLAAWLSFTVGCSAGGTINHTLRSSVPLDTFKVL